MLRLENEIYIYQTFKPSYFDKVIVRNLPSDFKKENFFKKDGFQYLIDQSTKLNRGDSCKYQRLSFRNSSISIEIDESWDNFTQSAKVIIPSNLDSIQGQVIDVNFVGIDSPYIINNNLSKEYINLISKNDKYNYFYGLKKDGKIDNSIEYNKDDIGLKTNPLISVGDIIEIRLGYIIRNNVDNSDYNAFEYGNKNIYKRVDGGNKIKISDDIDYRSKIFKGYISNLSVDSNGNTIIECEDMIYYLNKASIPNKTYHVNDKKNTTTSDFFSNKNGYSINSILVDMVNTPSKLIDSNNNIISGSTQSGIQNILSIPQPIFTYQSIENGPVVILNNEIGIINDKYIVYDNLLNISSNIDTNIMSDVSVSNTTIGEVFRKIKEDYQSNIPFFIRSERYGDDTESRYFNILNSLTFSPFKYKIFDGKNVKDNPDSQFHIFTFGDNIIDSNLSWYDSKDDIVGGIVTSNIVMTSIKKNKRGKNKKIVKKISESVGDSFGKKFTWVYFNTNLSLTTTEDGKTFVETDDIKSLRSRMREFGKEQLTKVNYSGYYGEFTTFGYPYVVFGDYIQIQDPYYPNRTGTYYVKSVVTRMDSSIGLQQTITIDYKIPNFELDYKN